MNFFRYAKMAPVLLLAFPLLATAEPSIQPRGPTEVEYTRPMLIHIALRNAQTGESFTCRDCTRVKAWLVYARGYPVDGYSIEVHADPTATQDAFATMTCANQYTVDARVMVAYTRNGRRHRRLGLPQRIGCDN